LQEQKLKCRLRKNILNNAVKRLPPYPLTLVS